MALCCCGAVCFPAVGILLYILYKYFWTAKKSSPQILEKDFKKDTVYLYQFPRSKTVPSVSPFCLKIETFLRVNNIAYENRFLTIGRSQYGLLPFVELNGEHIADSQIIYERLTIHFKIKGLSEEKEALARAVSRMLEGHSFYIFYKYKILDAPDKFVALMADDIGVPTILRPVALPIVSLMFKNTAIRRIGGSLGMFSEEEFDMLFRKDLDALRGILGEQKFLFGDSMSTADYSAFGILATGTYLPFETKISKVVKKDYPTLFDYCERIRQLAFEKDFTK